MRSPHFHFLRRNAPLGGMEIKFAPFCMTQLTGPHERERQKAEREASDWAAFELVDITKKSAYRCRVQNGRGGV